MSREDAIDILNQVLGRRMYSLPAYILNASPYLEPRDLPLWKRLGRIVEENKDWARRIALAIRELGGVPAPGMRDHSVATLNYLSLSFISGRIVDSLAGDLDFITRQRDRFEDYPKVREMLEELIRHDARVLEEVRTLVQEIQRQLAEAREERKRRKAEAERLRREAEQKAREEKAQKAAAARAARTAQAPADKKPPDENAVKHVEATPKAPNNKAPAPKNGESPPPPAGN